MKFLLGFITSTIFIATVFIGCWLYFDFPISTNDEKQSEPQTQQVQQEEIQKENTQQEQQPQNNVQEQQPQNNVREQQAPATIPTQENSEERLPNLHDKQKALNLMKQERSNLSDEDKKIYDGVIETAKTNINNGLGNQEDYNILNEYKK